MNQGIIYHQVEWMKGEKKKKHVIFQELFSLFWPSEKLPVHHWYKLQVPGGDGPEKKKSEQASFLSLTRNLTAVKLEPQRDAVLPRLRPDPYDAGQHRLWDPIENHLRGVGIGVENL